MVFIWLPDVDDLHRQFRVVIDKISSPGSNEVGVEKLVPAFVGETAAQPRARRTRMTDLEVRFLAEHNHLQKPFQLVKADGVVMAQVPARILKRGWPLHHTLGDSSRSQPVA